jgi:hypothetical protein
MAIQQSVQVDIVLVGDGSALTFTYAFSKLFNMLVNNGGEAALFNATTLPTSAVVVGNNNLPNCTASIDGFGNLVITFTSAPAAAAQGIISVQLLFNSGTLAGTTAAWTSATALNTTWTLPLNGSNSCSIGFVVTGSITGGAIVFQVSQDGANWLPIQGAIADGFTPLTGWTFGVGNRAVQFDVAGYAYLRLLLNPVLTGTGTVTFIFQASNAVAEPVPTVGQAIATNLQTMGNATYNSAAPTPAAAASVTLQADASGNLFVNNIRRSQVVTATGNIASTTAANIIAGQGAGIFADLSGILLTARLGATAAVLFGVNISDGTKTYRINMSSETSASGGGNPPVSVTFDPPLVATTANTAWTIALTSATDSPSVDYVCTFIKQQAS